MQCRDLKVTTSTLNCTWMPSADHVALVWCRPPSHCICHCTRNQLVFQHALLRTTAYRMHCIPVGKWLVCASRQHQLTYKMYFCKYPPGHGCYLKQEPWVSPDSALSLSGTPSGIKDWFYSRLVRHACSYPFWSLQPHWENNSTASFWWLGAVIYNYHGILILLNPILTGLQADHM